VGFDFDVGHKRARYSAARLDDTMLTRVVGATTPGRIRLFSLAIVAALVLAVVGDLAVVSRRHSGVVAFGADSGPLVVTAQRIQTDLQEADASAANAFLAGGIEPLDQRLAYQRSITAASSDLARATEQVGTKGAGDSYVATIATELPVYAGLVEQARAGNRQGFPIGAAYLRDASALLRAQLMPAAAGLAVTSATAVNNAKSKATSVGDVIAIVALMLLALVALVALQRMLLIRTRRILNLSLAAATLVVLIGSVALLVRVGAERNALVNANDQGYGPTAQITRARALGFEAEADLSEALIARGNGQSYLTDEAAAARGVTPLLSTTTTDTQTAFASWSRLEASVTSTEASGDHAGAVSRASQASATFNVFDAAAAAVETKTQQRFADEVVSAKAHLADLNTLVIIGGVIAALLALWGAQTRINDYR
jgi:hypothetical protein